MSRHRGPKLKIIRRLGQLPGLTAKNSARKKTNLKKKKSTQYGIRLEAKQKLRYQYGIGEKKLIRYFQKAKNLKGSTGKILIQLLEMRLDNILFRGGFAPTVSSARQLITHGHILVNDHKINIPSYNCQLNDKIEILKSSKISNQIKNFFNQKTNLLIPSYLKIDREKTQIFISSNFQQKEIPLKLEELLIIEYYSRN